MKLVFYGLCIPYLITSLYGAHQSNGDSVRKALSLPHLAPLVLGDASRHSSSVHPPHMSAAQNAAAPDVRSTRKFSFFTCPSPASAHYHQSDPLPSHVHQYAHTSPSPTPRSTDAVPDLRELRAELNNLSESIRECSHAIMHLTQHHTTQLGQAVLNQQFISKKLLTLLMMQKSNKSASQQQKMHPRSQHLSTHEARARQGASVQLPRLVKSNSQ